MHMTELSRALIRSWLRTNSQRVVPANAGTHHPWPQSEKRLLLQCRNENPRRMGPCVRRDDSLETPYAIALPLQGRVRRRLLTPSQIVIKYNYSGQDAISPWETPLPPRLRVNPRCSSSRYRARC